MGKSAWICEVFSFDVFLRARRSFWPWIFFFRAEANPISGSVFLFMMICIYMEGWFWGILCFGDGGWEMGDAQRQADDVGCASL
jgi:hypothetical protein